MIWKVERLSVFTWRGMIRSDNYCVQNNIIGLVNTFMVLSQVLLADKNIVTSDSSQAITLRIVGVVQMPEMTLVQLEIVLKGSDYDYSNSVGLQERTGD